MQTLSLIAPRSRNDEANLRSDRDGKLTGSSFVGTVLARRYKILEMIDADSFKAHDLALDQTVTLRRASLTSQCPSDSWCQKIHELASVRNTHFLNLLDVISDKSIDFVSSSNQCFRRRLSTSCIARPRSSSFACGAASSALSVSYA